MRPISTRPVLALLRLVSAMSWRSIYKLSNVLSWLLFNVIRYRKTVVWANLRNSFPDKSDEELRPVARSFYRHFSDLILETIKLQRATSTEILRRMNGSVQLVNELYEQGKSAIIILGHRGNWELANLFSALRFPHDSIIVYKPLSSPVFETWFRGLRTRFGSEVVPMNDVYKDLGRHRDKPFLLFLVNDQSPDPDRSYWTSFMKQDTGVFRGAELLARRYNLPVIYADIRKSLNGRGFYEMEMQLITENPKKLPNNAILEQQIRYLEKDISREPSNWLWTHRRWKHRKPGRLKPEQLPVTAESQSTGDISSTDQSSTSV